MKTFNERQALVAAVSTSALALVAAFGVAWAMRAASVSSRLADVPGNAQAATVSQNLTADAAQGRHLFLMNCAHCHADDAHGDEGPDLYDLRKSDERIRRQIIDGVKGEMPSFAKKLGEAEVRQLTAYLRTLHG
ncbi:MAG TPA: cytochrome c [Chthoniobacterales bacterium]|nr:cytochrome c [Chthoniobacterales bacterium]